MSMFGALVAAVGSFLPWFDAFGITTNSFDVAAPFLLDYQTTASDTVTIGAVVVILAGAAVVACLVPRFVQRAVVLRGLGLALVAAAGLFAFQLARTADDVGVSFGDLIGIGPIVTSVGALAVFTAR